MSLTYFDAGNGIVCYNLISTPNTTSNTSTLRFEFGVYSSFYSSITGVSGYVIINGTSYQPTSSVANNGTWYRLGYVTTTIAHNSDGSAPSITAIAYFPTYASSVLISDETRTFTWVIEDIDRTAPTITVSFSNITSTGYTLTATANTTCSTWQYRLSDTSTWTTLSSSSATSVSLIVSGKTAATTYTYYVRATKTSNSVVGTSSATSVTTLGAATLNSVTSFAVDVASPAVVMNWTPQTTSFYYTLDISYDDTSILTITGITASSTGTSNKSISLTEAQRTAILEYMEVDTSITATFTLTTYSDSAYTTQIGDSSSVTATISTTEATSAPTFSDTSFNYYDNNDTTLAITNDSSILIKTYSDLVVDVPTATALNGAYISYYTVDVGSKSVMQSDSGSLDFGSVSSYGTISIILTAYDSRGYSCSITVEATCINYSDIIISDYTLRRVNEVESTVQLYFTGSLSPIYIDEVKQNSIQSARFNVDSGDWIDIDITEYSSSFRFDSDALTDSDGEVIDFDSNTAYTLTIEITDLLSTETLILTVTRGTPLMSFRSQKIGINVSEPTSALDVDGDIKMNGYNVQGFIGDVEATTSLNNITDSGLYYVHDNTSTVYHRPSDEAGVLEVVCVGGYCIMQRYTNVSGSAVYSRTYYSEAWSDWLTISTT